ncbi:P-loop containing nucleoside triphosphate hydrolase protein [Xylariales sp. PMI_506]|nr:P-loop containing nucleoside triphosphate hydrolase protein [Xylariales sp. PMI_506]
MPGSNGSKLFDSLNEAQCQAVSSKAATVAVLAGPGSGKTHTLSSRVVWLIDHANYAPSDVLVATFTVKAAREMKERIGKALGGGRERKIILGTFHSIARRYLATYGSRIGLDPKFGIADDSDSRGIVARICKRLDVQIDVPVARAWISKKKAGGTVAAAKAKKTVESQAFETCYAEYQSQLDRSNLLDYDDLLVRCVELLRKHPSCVENIQAVLIDEYQDTNGIQFELMKLFAQQKRRITIVGDPDQSIYGWRSAEIKNLHRFLRDFPGTEEVSLEENYRSSSHILDISLKVIQQDKERYQKALLPVHNKGTRPVLRKLKSQVDEADWIISEIKRSKMMSGEMLTSDDIAILIRSASLSRHIESALGRAGLPYRMIGGFKFYERTEIKVLLDYLRIISQPDNNDALARIINVPKRGIGVETIKALLEEAERNSLSLWSLLTKHCRGDRIAKTKIRKQTELKISGEVLKLINNLRTRLRERTDGGAANLVETIENLVQELQFEKLLEETYPLDHESRWANVQEFLGLANEFMKDQQAAEEDLLPSIPGLEQNHDSDVLARFLANVSLASDKQTNSDEQAGKPMITVSTIHAAKGLEWPVVFIPGAYKGSIPHMRSDDEAEERRLLYVAMTRAKALLYLSWPLYSSNGNGDGLELSPFISSLPSNSFSQKGPSFERQTMLEVGRIIHRDLPPDDAIYKGLPLMSPIEDNLFPVDPSAPKYHEVSSVDNPTGAHRMKRHKMHHVGSSADTIAPNSVEGWNTPYATTMQSASTFTLPGFTTASAQHVASATESTAPPRAPPIRTATNKRPAGQRSLLGYIIKDHDQSKVEDSQLQQPPLPSSYSRIYPLPRNQKQQAAQEISPELSNHKLGAAKLISKPVPKKHDVPVVAKQYACFSSSPTKPSPDAAQTEVNTVPEEPARSATCFHATTVNVMPIQRGFKRPAGLGRDGIAPIDRLRKPFKPLTINRQ